MTGEGIGGEPVRYVANIRKYYVAYQLLEEQREEARGRRELVTMACEAGHIKVTTE